MSRPLDLTIVVPAFNEESRLGATLGALCTHLAARPWSWEIRVVDDGSTDRTVRVVEEVAAREPRVVVQREPHRGKGGAVRAGMLAARGAFRFMCDADLSMPVRELDRFLPPALTGCDIAIATREGPGAVRVDEPLRRHLVGRAFNTIVRWTMVPGIQDTQCGFKLFTAGAVEAVFPYVTTDGWAFDVEVLYLARLRGLRVCEVPIEWQYRSESRLNVLRHGPMMFLDLVRIRARARRAISRA